MEKEGLDSETQKGLETKLEQGLTFKRVYTDGETSPYDMLTYEKRHVKIVDNDDPTKIILERNDIEVPSEWGQVGTDILTKMYLLKTGVPETGSENSLKQVVHRVSHTIRTVGEENKYFQSKEDAQTFEDELAYILLTQRGAFNSPVWFNCGLYHDYGIEGSNVKGPWGNWAYNSATGEYGQVPAYTRPQASACFIQKIEDDMTSIFSQLGAEAMLFKYGSGTGTNFSALRGEGELLSGGGSSSGLISFLKVFDAGAGVIKSGGKTRRAAKMVVLDIDHPDIEKLIQWKSNEEKKVIALVAAGYPSGIEGEAYQTVSGQNSNNSVRLTNKFMQSVLENGNHQTIARTTGKTWKEYKSKDLWDMITQSAWQCGDPGLQFDDTINKWNTCKNSGRINASNPCSEFMFLDDSACNLASLNLKKFLDENGKFDVESYKHACEIFITAQEILVDLSSYPRKEIAKNTHEYRPLGLGYSNLGGLLMGAGLAYDSDEARDLAATLTAIMTGSAYAQSARIAKNLGPFQEFEKNREPMLEVIKMHKEAIKGIKPKKDLEYLIDAATKSWTDALELGEKHGYRNAQATVLAPTGTTSFLMECDTFGVEPDYAIVKYKKLIGGSGMKIVNHGISSALKKLGYNEKQVKEINDFIMEKNTVEGAPHIKEEHYSIFDCANKSPEGTRYIKPMGHVKMMAAIQPFISGAISKTVNLPNDATSEEISEIYMESWKMGVKAIALYRDGCKLSQPLNTTEDKKGDSLEKKLVWNERKKLPAIREGLNVGAKIGEHGLIVKTGEYDDGTVGEVFIDMYKEGNPYQSAMHWLSISMSKSLQYGMPLEKLVDTYLYNFSEPSGIVLEHPYIKFCSSVMDFVAKVLAIEYLGRTDLANVPIENPLQLRSNKLKLISELLKGKDVQEIVKRLNLQKKEDEKKVMQPDGRGKRTIGDGPQCRECNYPTVRTGACYTCTNCGTSSGGCG